MAVATISVNFASQAEVLAGTVATKSISPATLLPAISSTGVVQVSGGPGIATNAVATGIAGVSPTLSNLNTKTFATSSDQIMIYDSVASSFYSTTIGNLSGAINRVDQASFTIAKPLTGDSFILLRTTFPMQLLTAPSFIVGTGGVTAVTISPSTAGSILAPGTTMTATVGSCTPDIRNIVISFGFKYL